MDPFAFAGGQEAECPYLVRTLREAVALNYRCGADRHWVGMTGMPLASASAMVESGVGGRHNERCGAGDLHGLRRETGQLPQRICTLAAGRTGAAVAAAVAAVVVVEEIPETVTEADGSNAMKCLGCCYNGCGEHQEAQGRHPRWAVAGCLSVVQVHGGYAMSVIGSRVHWRRGGRVEGCYEGQ
jgi:hypothetical protein